MSGLCIAPAVVLTETGHLCRLVKRWWNAKQRETVPVPLAPTVADAPAEVSTLQSINRTQQQQQQQQQRSVAPEPPAKSSPAHIVLDVGDAIAAHARGDSSGSGGSGGAAGHSRDSSGSGGVERKRLVERQSTEGALLALQSPAPTAAPAGAGGAGNSPSSPGAPLLAGGAAAGSGASPPRALAAPVAWPLRKSAAEEQRDLPAYESAFSDFDEISEPGAPACLTPNRVLTCLPACARVSLIVMQYGYVALFTAAFPLAPLLGTSLLSCC